MKKKIRSSVLSGTWYPGDAEELKVTIKDYFSQIKIPKMDKITGGIIAPHAGYMYSGLTAAHAYKAIEGLAYDVIVILAPLHRMPMGRYVINKADFYQTPMGMVPIHKNLIDKLSEIVKITFVDSEEEHAIEIQLPFIQSILKETPILPIMIGITHMDQCDDIVNGLATLLKSVPSLIIMSTDLHHISNYDEVVSKDNEVIKVFKTFDLSKIRDRLEQPDCSVCGRVAIYIGLSVLTLLGAESFHVLHHTNSGDVTGDRFPGQYTVGYLAAAVT